MTDPLFTVIVPTRNRPELLGSCLESLARQRYPAAHFEVVVVDDGSPHPVTDVVLGYRERLRVSAHRQPNGGPAAARNAGAGVARGTYLAFIDDDCEAAPDWLATYEQAFRGDGRPVLLGGWTLNPDPGRVLPEISQLILRTMRLRYRPERGGIYFFGAANIAVRADEFHRIGGFDTSFTTAEDRELCDRWLHQGGMLTDVPGASVFHTGDPSLSGFLRRYFQYGRGAYRFHLLRRRRKSGAFRADFLLFYLRVLDACFSPPRPSSLLRAGVWGAWQIANAAGFTWELVQERSGRLRSGA